jgi:uncharacterized Zn finger protein (UPF0148 family)
MSKFTDAQNDPEFRARAIARGKRTVFLDVSCPCGSNLFAEPGTGETVCDKCGRHFIRFGRRWVVQEN